MAISKTKAAKREVKKKRNPIDLTLRNLNAMKKRVTNLELLQKSMNTDLLHLANKVAELLEGKETTMAQNPTPFEKETQETLAS